MHRQPYSTDLTDAEWTALEPHLPKSKPGGRPRVQAIRELLHAMFDILRSGCA
jgi:transposase